MKSIISKCAVFAGAQTHSTIAALSTEVPTFSLGYSLKARGLNKDIFGSQDYCVDCSKLTIKIFVERTTRLLNEKEAIGALLRTRLPSIRERTYQGGPLLRQILEG